MTIPSKEKIISELEAYLKMNLSPVPGKQIIYQGNSEERKQVVVCTPQSKMHSGGFGWSDLTTIQVSILDSAYYGILAFRLEGIDVYYVRFDKLKEYLTPEALVNNRHEGDHWKLRIWPDRIEVLGNNNYLKIQANNIGEL